MTYPNLRADPENPRWDFMIITRFPEDGERVGLRGCIASVTVHRGEGSRDMEVSSARSLNRSVKVIDLRGLDKWQRRSIKERELV